MLLLFLHAGNTQDWWHIDASGRIMARGSGTLPDDAGAIIAAPPADAVALYKVALPALAPAQAQAAARHLAAERSAASIDSLHTAISAANKDGARWLAVTSLAAMTDWQSRLAAQAITAPLVPLPLLLPGSASFEIEGMQVVHSDALAFAAEPELAAALIPALPPGLDDSALAKAVAAGTPLLDLRQGRFARATVFRPAQGQLRRLVLLAASAAALWVAGDVASWWQLHRAASAAEAQNDQLAAKLLPPGTGLSAPRAQVEALVARSRSGAASRMAAPLLESLAARPNISLAALTLEAGRLIATLDAASPGDVAAIETALRAQGFAANAGLPRTVAGRAQVDLTVAQP